MNEKVLAEGRINTRALKISVLVSLVALLIVSLLTLGKVGLSYDMFVSIQILPFGVIFIFSLLRYLYARKMHIVVSDKRVYGESVFGRKVDLPIDSISAIGKKRFTGIGVATSAGKIVFFGFKNRDEIYETVSNLLVKRQSSNQAMNTSQSSADELSKYKKLLDDGVISQEEFDAKKKQLLDF